MALEAQGEFLWCKFTRISICIVRGEEQFGLGSGVGSVAIGALAFCDGRMAHRVELSEDFMAFSAQRGLVAKKEGAVFRGMGRVTIGAAAVRDCFVDHRAAIDHAVVAFLAEPFGRTREKFGAFRRMGIVAGQTAIFFDNAVKLPFHEIIMAFGT